MSKKVTKLKIKIGNKEFIQDFNLNNTNSHVYNYVESQIDCSKFDLFITKIGTNKEIKLIKSQYLKDVFGEKKQGLVFGRYHPDVEVEHHYAKSPQIVFANSLVDTPSYEDLPKFGPKEDCSTTQIRIPSELVMEFGKKCVQEQFKYHRVAYLFGRILKYTGKVNVHAVVEPKQVKTSLDTKIDFDMDAAQRLAKTLNLELVGILASHGVKTIQEGSEFKEYVPQNDFDFVVKVRQKSLLIPPLSEYFCKLAAKHTRDNEYFTVVAVGPTTMDGDKGAFSLHFEVSAYQVFDALVDADRYGMFEESDQPWMLHFSNQGIVDLTQKNYRKKVHVAMLVKSVPIKNRDKTIFNMCSFYHPYQIIEKNTQTITKYFKELKKDYGDHPLKCVAFDFRFLLFLLNINFEGLASPGVLEDFIGKLLSKNTSSNKILDTLEKFRK